MDDRHTITLTVGPDLRSEFVVLQEMSTALRLLPDRHVCTCAAFHGVPHESGRHIVCSLCKKVVRSETLDLQAQLRAVASRGDA